MARISEFEQRGSDTLEIAIGQDEYDRLGSATDPFELRVTILSDTGAEQGSFLLSTDPTDWAYDADTEEYLLIVPINGYGNHRTSWDGMVLSSTNEVGLDTVEHALMVAPFDEAVDADGTLSTTVTAATHIPVGTALTLIDQSVVVGTGKGATLLFNAPDINTPIVSREDDLGNTGSAPPICFVDGTHITCEHGERRVETLHVGDRVQTLHHGLQTIRWIGRVALSSDTLRHDPLKRPIRIDAGTLGTDLPTRDLHVSRQHRIVVDSTYLQILAGLEQALIPAHRLTDLPGVTLVCPKQKITYFHLLFDKHEVVFANGMPTESLLLGDQARGFLPPAAVLEIEELGIGAATAKSVLPILTSQQQRALVAHHATGALPIYAPQPEVTPDLGTAA